MKKITPDEMRKARYKTGLTQDEMRKILGCSHRTLQRWERDGANIPGVVAIAIDKILRDMSI